VSRVQLGALPRGQQAVTARECGPCPVPCYHRRRTMFGWFHATYASCLPPSGLSAGLLKKSCPVASGATAPLVTSAWQHKRAQSGRMCGGCSGRGQAPAVAPPVPRHTRTPHACTRPQRAPMAAMLLTGSCPACEWSSHTAMSRPRALSST
jgi:hypothetical protein